MKNLILLCLFGFIGVQPVSAQFGKLIDKAKNSSVGKEAAKVLGDESGDLDISGGLKEALEKGVDEAVQSLSATNGYLESPYKILLPAEAQQVVNKVKKVPGFGDVEEKLVEKLNRAAETAAVKAKPIFVGAIKKMTFKDAFSILSGKDDAATRYLEKNTSTELTGEFKPVIQNSLDEVNARSYWKTVVTAYNKIPFVKKTNPELDEYVTEKALEGMFNLVEKKEAGIRTDISQRSSDLLRRVFEKQDS